MLCYLQVVGDLISLGAAHVDAFEWVRHVRHYWDPEGDMLYVAFAQVSGAQGGEAQGSEGAHTPLLAASHDSLIGLMTWVGRIMKCDLETHFNLQLHNSYSSSSFSSASPLLHTDAPPLRV